MPFNHLKTLTENQIKRLSGTILSSDDNSCVFKMKEDQYQVSFGTPTYNITRVGDPTVLLAMPPIPPIIIMKLSQFSKTL